MHTSSSITNTNWQLAPVETVAGQEAVCCRPWWSIPLLVETANLLTALGNGMTFKFWPLFYKSDLGFGPKVVCIMSVAMWLAITCGVQLAPRIVKYFGRGGTAVAGHYAGTALMFVISTGPGVGPTVVLVLLRYMLMKASSPVLQGVVMDFVPAQHRGKFSTIESFKMMGWACSASLGGWVSDHYGYCHAFRATASVHCISGVFLLLAALLLHRHEQSC